IAYLYRSKHFLRIRREELNYLRIDPAILRSLIGKGVPMGLQMIVMSTSMIAMISLVNSFGAHTTAAYGACFQLWNYIQMPSLAVGMPRSGLPAQTVGAGLGGRVDKAALPALAFNFFRPGSLVLVFSLSNHAAFGLFLPADGDSIGIAQHINHIVVWSFVL